MNELQVIKDNQRHQSAVEDEAEAEEEWWACSKNTLK